MMTLKFEHNGQKYQLVRYDDKNVAINDQQLIADKMEMSKEYLEKKAKQLLEKHKGLVGQLFTKIKKDMEDSE